MIKSYCSDCKYWSDKVAKSEGGGPLMCMCLNRNSKVFQEYRASFMSCEFFQKGDPIDRREQND